MEPSQVPSQQLLTLLKTIFESIDLENGTNTGLIQDARLAPYGYDSYLMIYRGEASVPLVLTNSKDTHSAMLVAIFNTQGDLQGVVTFDLNKMHILDDECMPVGALSLTLSHITDSSTMYLGKWLKIAIVDVAKSTQDKFYEATDVVINLFDIDAVPSSVYFNLTEVDRSKPMRSVIWIRD